MDIQGIFDIINSVGFPIAMVGFLLWYVNGFTKRIMDENQVRETEHRDFQKDILAEMNAITQTLARVNSNLDSARAEHEKLMEGHEDILKAQNN